MKRTLLLLPLLLLTACSSSPNGYWEGKGVATQVMIHDSFKKLNRKATFDFWFVVTGDHLRGEADIDYDAELRVENLPAVNTGFATFAPSVAGHLTDLDPHRRFPISGTLQNGTLSIDIDTPVDQRPKLTLTIRADAGVTVSVGGPGSGGRATGGKNVVSTYDVPMKPFTPFSTADKPCALVHKRPLGTFAADYDSHAETYSVRWTARRISNDAPSLQP